jgi:hypothetical protein
LPAERPGGPRPGIPSDSQTHGHTENKADVSKHARRHWIGLVQRFENPGPRWPHRVESSIRLGVAGVGLNGIPAVNNFAVFYKDCIRARMPVIPEMNTSHPGPAFERVYPAKSRYCECVVGCAICERLFEVIGDKIIIPWIRSGCRHLFVWQANVTAPWQHCNRQQERRSHSVPRRTRPLALKTGPALPAQENPPHPAQKRVRIFSRFLEHPYGELNAFHLNGPFSGASVNNNPLLSS